MINKSRIIGVLSILVVVLLVFRPGNERGEPGGDSDTPTDGQRQPREPAFLTPESDFGIAKRPDATSRRRPGNYPGSYAGPPYPSMYSDPSSAQIPYGEDARIATSGYRFRPLSEREQQRMRASVPEQGPTSYYPPPAARQRAPAPDPRFATPLGPDTGHQAYSFRPLEKPPGARGRWQGPYQQPSWRSAPYPEGPWTSPPDPQWGSTPPAQRMYPNFYQESGRRLTAR